MLEVGEKTPTSIPCPAPAADDQINDQYQQTQKQPFFHGAPGDFPPPGFREFLSTIMTKKANSPMLYSQTWVVI